MVSCTFGVFLTVLVSSLANEFNQTTSDNSTDIKEAGPTLREVACDKPQDCRVMDGSYCDVDVGLCLCKPDYPVTDTHHCYKGI